MIVYEPQDNEEVIFSIAIKTKMAIISHCGCEFSFKVLHSDGLMVDFYCSDLDKITLMADILRTGRPLPYGLPYRIDPTTNLERSSDGKKIKGNKYQSDREIVMIEATAPWTRTVRFRERAEYGHCIQMDISARHEQADEISPKVGVFDIPQWDCMYAFTKVARIARQYLQAQTD